MPSFSDDEVLDFLVTEAIHRRVSAAEAKANKDENRAEARRTGGKELAAQMRGQL